MPLPSLHLSSLSCGYSFVISWSPTPLLPSTSSYCTPRPLLVPHTISGDFKFAFSYKIVLLLISFSKIILTTYIYRSHIFKLRSRNYPSTIYPRMESLLHITLYHSLIQELRNRVTDLEKHPIQNNDWDALLSFKCQRGGERGSRTKGRSGPARAPKKILAPEFDGGSGRCWSLTCPKELGMVSLA